MSATRLYDSNNNRLATGRQLPNGHFLQVFPVKRLFHNEDGWPDFWMYSQTPYLSGFRFVTEDDLLEESAAAFRTPPRRTRPLPPLAPRKLRSSGHKQ